MSVEEGKKQAGETTPQQEHDFILRGIQTRCWESDTGEGRKGYRTIFRVRELETLHVDVQWENLRFQDRPWEAELVAGVFFMGGDAPLLVGQREARFVVPETHAHCQCTLSFASGELENFTFREGAYRIKIMLNGVDAVSEEILLMESRDHLTDYFSLVDAGLDRCEESDREREHSFRSFNIAGLQDVSVYLVAMNRLSREWTYEFVLRIFDLKEKRSIIRAVKSNDYHTVEGGERVIFFLEQLAGDVENFWHAGEYVVEVCCFDQLVITLPFTLGEEDIPYLFTAEVEEAAARLAKEGAVEQQAPAEQKEDPRPRLYQLVGLRKIKEELTHAFEVAEFVKVRRENGFSDPYPVMNMLFMGNQGAGKSTVAALVGEVLFHLGILSKGTLHRYRREHFSRPGVAAEETLVREAIEKSKGGVLFIEDAEEFYPTNDPNDKSLHILSLLLNIMTEEKPPLLLILSGREEMLQAIFKGMPDMKTAIPIQFTFADYNAEELMEITRKMLEKRQFVFAPEAEKKFSELLADFCLDHDYEEENAHFVEAQLEHAASHMAKRLMGNRAESYSKEEISLIREEDVATYVKPDTGKALAKFNDMIGSGELKQSIMGYVNYVSFLCERQKHGFTEPFPPLNMIFSGNPGTGKSSIAKMLGEILESLRVLDRAQVQVKEYADLVGDGSYAPQQFALYAYEQARGGILYIRECQRLLQDNQGLAALGAIVGQLSHAESGETIVILGGTAAEMERFLISNPKLKPVFPYLFHFEDYKSDELYQIALQKIKEKNYTVHPKTKETIQQWVDRICQEQSSSFGNALLVKEMIDKAIKNLSDRLMKNHAGRELTRKEITTLMPKDIPVVGVDFPVAGKASFEEEDIRAALKELDQMVGQDKLKRQIHDFVNLARHYNQEGIKLTSRLSLQWCFTGNSGMGKGTVARIISRLYKAMGLIEKSDVFRFKAEKLLGVSEEDISATIGAALSKSQGGLFFFDEDSPRLSAETTFKNRLRALLANQMMTRPGAYTVIYADQNPPKQIISDEIEKMSDIINVLKFEDYSKAELMEILKRDLASENYMMDSAAQQHIALLVDRLLEQKSRSQASARLIKLVGEMIVRNHIQRVAKENGEKENRSITMEDVKELTPESLISMTQERKAIGFN